MSHFSITLHTMLGHCAAPMHCENDALELVIRMCPEIYSGNWMTVQNVWLSNQVH